MSVDNVRRALESVVTIAVTPFDADGAVDARAYAAVLTRCVDAGIDVVTANGNTGEFYSLGAAERELAVHTTVAAVGQRATVLAGVGHDVADAVAAATAAARAGAHGVMVHQPVHPYQSAQGWVDYHRRIADAVPELGVVCYVRSPALTGAAFVALADACPNVVGVKYAVPDVVALADLIGAVGAGRWVWSCGLAETWAPYFWLSGARGFTSGLATVAPRYSLDLLGQLRTGDFAAATATWRRLRAFEDMRARGGSALNVSVVKEALAQLGICRRDVRPPIGTLTPAERDEVTTILADLEVPLPVAV
ncbi:dihydrodipicolinate synthase family protein [Rugosimonospora acidiphila]|uniref:Dihydrodipicolinate synthase family protein n=1 Tax=Rugosimonospora acidiphila TaxID=556531 RepID=A0ABP9RVU3_9ACTN